MTPSPLSQEDEIDLVALLRSLFQWRWLIVKTTLIFVFIGIIVALVSATKYESSTVFIVEGEKEQVGSSLSGLAALAGINLGSGSNGSIPASLYPKIVGSLEFKLQVLDLILPQTQQRYFDYLESQNKSILPFNFSFFLGNDPDKEQNIGSLNQGYYSLDKKTYELTKLLEEVIRVEVNEKEGFVSLLAQDQDPEIAAFITSRSLGLLQQTIINYKTENAQRVLKYLDDQFEKKSKEYVQIQKELAEFKDQNKNISTAVFESNLQKLQTRYDLVYTVYIELSKQIEQAKLQVNKDIPNISIIEPVVVPQERESPKRKLIVIIFGFLGGVLSCGWILIKNPLGELYIQIKD